MKSFVIIHREHPFFPSPVIDADFHDQVNTLIFPMGKISLSVVIHQSVY
jgi:hypothetical protein